jgi:hypothetical protein
MRSLSPEEAVAGELELLLEHQQHQERQPLEPDPPVPFPRAPRPEQ